MVRRAAWLLSLMLLAVFACFSFWQAATASAADYTPPTSPFTEPAFSPKLALTPSSWYQGQSCAAFNFRGESGEAVKYALDQSWNQSVMCGNLHAGIEGILKRLFWVTEEVIKEREQLESLKAEVVKGLGAEGSIAKALAQLHTDLTLTEGLPIRWKSQAAEPEVKFKTAQAVTLASLPELAAGSKAIGSVKVTTLEGEPAIKVGNEPAVKVSSLPELAAGSKAIGSVKVTTLEGEPAIKVGNEPAVKVSSLPELAAGSKAIGTVNVASLEGEPAFKLSEAPPELVSSVDAAGEATQAAIYVIAGLLAGFFIGYILWRTVHSAT
jgi:predicted Abi (CAAX) family protease